MVDDPVPLAPSGWYADPIEPGRFRKWSGSQWLNSTFSRSEGLLRDRVDVANFPRPTSYPAPELPGRNRRPLRVGFVAVVVFAGFLILRAVTTSDGETAGAGVAAKRPRFSQAEVHCARQALTRDEVLVDGATSYRPGVGGVDHGWASAGDQLDLVPLDACTPEFAVSFSRYAQAVQKFGAFLEDRTGTAALDDFFDSHTDEKLRTRLDEVNLRYRDLGVVASEIGISAVRTDLSLDHG